MSDALDLLASLVLEDQRRWGEAAVAQQWADAKAVADVDSPTPYHFLTRARGFSKTADLAGMAVATMLADLPERSRLYGLAADLEQGRLLVDSVAGFAARTPELQGALQVDAYRVRATRSGSVLEILSADAPGAWGIRPAFLIVDELAQWGTTGAPRRLWDAAMTALAKVPGARAAVLTTAGDPAHWSHAVLEHARTDRLWRVHEVSGPPPWADPERLAEQRRRLPESIYRRLFENQWTASEDRLASPDDLRACVAHTGPLAFVHGRRYALGVDLGLKRDATVAVVAHAERLDRPDAASGVRVVLDRIQVWQGSRLRPVRLSDVEEWVAMASREYGRARVVMDPWQGVGLAQRLRRGGALVQEYPFSQQSVGRLAVTMLQLIRDQALDLPDDEELIDELANVRLRETSPGILRLDHDADRHDDRAIALALAAHSLVERGAPGVALVSTGLPRGRILTSATQRVGLGEGSAAGRMRARVRALDAADAEAAQALGVEGRRV
jgi:phage terminase large subunit-like protein